MKKILLLLTALFVMNLSATAFAQQTAADSDEDDEILIEMEDFDYDAYDDRDDEEYPDDWVSLEDQVHRHQYTLEDDFTDNDVIFVLTRAASRANPMYTPEDFPDMGVTEVSRLTNAPGVKYHIFLLTLDRHDKQNVLDVIDRIWEMDGILSVEPNLIYTAQQDDFSLGDADGDGDLTVLDATRIQCVTAGLEDDSTINRVAADVDRDGEVTVMDATRIQRTIAGFCSIDGTLIQMHPDEAE